MKTFFSLLTAALLVAVLLTACGCNHEWAEADCYDPQTCTKCGATEGEKLGHDYQEANCEAPRTCSRCGKTKGAALGHIWTEADCDDPAICQTCNATGTAALGHAWTEADCLNAKTCQTCGVIEGDALGHDFSEATCEEASACTRCGEFGSEALGHVYDDSEPDCENPKTCGVCGKQEAEATEHIWVDATYEAPKTCSVCGKTEGDPLQQEGQDTTVNLGLSVLDYNAYMNELLVAYNAELIYVSENTDYVLYVLYDGAAGTLLDVYAYYQIADGYVSYVMIYTESALEESPAFWTGVVGALGMLVADPTITDADIQTMLSEVDYVDEDGSYTYYMDKNGISHSLTCNDTTGEAYFLIIPLE